MAKETTFKVSKRGIEEEFEVSFLEPESIEDPRWEELVSDYPGDINSLAVRSLVINIQAGARQRLEQGADAVQSYVDSYKYGARTGGFSKPSISKKTVKEQKFTDEQLAALKAAGVQIED